MMTTIRFCFSLVLISLFVGPLSGQTYKPGNLVIVGGNLADDNATVFETFIRLAGGTENAEIAVIPTAGGSPVQSFVYFRSLMQLYGVPAKRVHLLPIALADDDSTTDVDESTWKKNSENQEYADLARKCSGIWFTGGDQLRTMQALVLPGGKKSPVLESVWHVYQTGGVLGGTSAGAAIMSETMIGGGTSLSALTHGAIFDYQGEDFPPDQGVLVVRGLGFFPFGIVDQHFHARARIGRLSVAMMQAENRSRYSFGIDENTALIYYGEDQRLTVAGEGGVTILDAINASILKKEKRNGIENLLVSYLEEGAIFYPETGEMRTTNQMKPLRANNKPIEVVEDHHGILTPDIPNFREIITQHLVDNEKKEPLEYYTAANSREGFLLKLSKSSGWSAFSTPCGRNHRYALTGIRMDILPVSVIYSR